MITKSDYIKSIQCDKYLWLNKNKPELATKKPKKLFDVGNQVGQLAQSLFPNGAKVQYSQNHQDMADETYSLIADGESVIYEAAFIHNNTFVMIDILVKNGTSWDIYEVKASTKAKEIYIYDLSLQWYIISANISLNKAHLVTINNKYTRNGELEIDQLFKLNDLTETVISKEKEIIPGIGNIREVLAKDKIDTAIGPHCNSPYPCPFKEHCWQDVPTDSVLKLYRMKAESKFALHHDGIRTYKDAQKHAES